MEQRKLFIDTTHEQLSVRQQCALLAINRSSLYYNKVEDQGDVELLNLIREIWLNACYLGYRKITIILNRDYNYGVVNHKRVQRLMQSAGIAAIYPKPNLSKKKSGDSTRPYLLKDLIIERINQVWMVDITYLRLGSRFVYLVAFIDVHSRYIVGWQLSYDLDTENSLEALQRSLKMGIPEIINSDQGCQYTSEVWLKTLILLGIKVSHDGVGRWADNIYIERFWRSIKYEAIFLNDFDTYESLYNGVKMYVNFYNEVRPHQSLAYKTPKAVYFSG